MHSWENDTAFVGELLNRIHQDTKSARLIAVCKRTLKSGRLENPVVVSDFQDDGNLLGGENCYSVTQDWLQNSQIQFFPKRLIIKLASSIYTIRSQLSLVSFNVKIWFIYRRRRPS